MEPSLRERVVKIETQQDQQIELLKEISGKLDSNKENTDKEVKAIWKQLNWARGVGAAALTALGFLQKH